MQEGGLEEPDLNQRGCSTASAAPSLHLPGQRRPPISCPRLAKGRVFTARLVVYVGDSSRVVPEVFSGAIPTSRCEQSLGPR